MPEIPYEKGTYYIFERGYNDFSNLFKIEQIEATFVVRAKRNLQFRQISWKRRLPKWTWYDNYDVGIPNTNNALEGQFADLKTKLRNHNGLSKDRRKLFIDQYFRASFNK